MKIDIWSDVACPFCYIGKRHLEKALENFPHKDKVEVIWHSYQLDPEAVVDNPEDQVSLLAKKYGMSREQALKSTGDVTAYGAAAGITFDFEKLKPTNTFNAHRLIQLGAVQGKQDEIEEALFKAYFTEGKHIGKPEVLESIALDAGMDATGLFASDEQSEAVKKDEMAAAQLKIRGVPFFVFDMKYGVSGAQPVEVFSETLQKVWDETNPTEIIPLEGKGDVCEDGVCN